MIDWNYIVLGACVLLLLFLGFAEIRRRNKSRLIWRIFATVFAVISLACLALPITYNSVENVTVTHEGILLTEGFNGDSVNRFVSANNNNIPVVTTHKSLKDADKYNAVYVANANSLSQQYKGVNTFHVFGYGLEKDEFDNFKNLSLIFHPTDLPDGITAINWPQRLKSGEELLVQGTYNNPSSAKTRIVLSGFNTTLDSIAAGEKDEKFSLLTIPKHSGRALYSIAVIAGKDTIEKESLPVQVEQGEPLKVLILASSPDFDNKFLMNQLSQNGYKVVARTAISKNKYVKNFLNAPAMPLDRITSSVLDKFDITIADAAELASITKTELATIQAQVAQKSMGLIIKADSALAGSAFYTSRFPLISSPANALEQVRVYISDSTGKMPATTIENPVFIRSQTGTQTLVFDKQNKAYANTALFGSGKIILTTLTNTYNWALAGNEDDYNKFWTELLNKVAPKAVADEVWAISPALAEVNKPVQLQVATNTVNPQGQVNSTPVFLKGDYDLPYQWKGTFYPVKQGWQSSVQLNGNVFYWWAYGNGDWQHIEQFERTEATRRYILENNKLIQKKEEIEKTVETEFPKVYFFLLFLICCGFLWAEDKNLLSF